MMNRKLKPGLHILAVALVISAGVAFPVGWLLTRLENASWHDGRRSRVLEHIGMVKSNLEVLINSRMARIRGLAYYVSTHPGLNREEFDSFAKTIADSEPGIRSVQLAKNNVISHVYPLQGNDGMLGVRLPADLPWDQTGAVRRMLESGKTVVAGPVRLVQGGNGLVGRTPIFVTQDELEPEKGAYWGIASLIIDTDILFHEAKLYETQDVVAIRGKDGLGERGEVIFGDPAVFRHNPVMLQMVIPGGSWQIAATPKEGTASSPFLPTLWGLVGAAGLGMGLVLWGLLMWPLRLREAVDAATLKLHNVNEELERKVLDRTQELQNANDLLLEEIEERRRWEEALVQSEDMARRLFVAVEQSPATVVITDLQGGIEYVNSRFVETTGYSREEALGQNPRVLKSGESRPEEYTALWETILSGREWTGEFHNKRKNGELYWEHASISPIRNAFGTITHFLAVKEEITERKRMEEELALNTRRAEALLTLNRMNDRSEEELIAYAIRKATLLTRSANSYLALVNEEHGALLLRDCYFQSQEEVCLVEKTDALLHLIA